MIFKDYYKILELKDNKVNIEEIKIAFREQAKKYHPDVNQGPIAEERFKDISEAYRILSNSQTKRKYDHIWYSHVGRKLDKDKQKQEREEKPNLFTLLFGNVKSTKQREEKNVPVKGENIETEIKVTLEQAFYGTNKKISLRAVDGKMKSFSIKVPAGIRNGEKIRLIGQGKQGINGAKNGDLLIRINIENDKKYRLEGYDIYTDLELTPWEAVLGTRAKVNTIDDVINVYIPQGVSSGEKIKIQSKGYKDGKGSRGDLIAQVKIVIPKTLKPEEIELYNQLKKLALEKNKTNTNAGKNIDI